MKLNIRPETPADRQAIFEQNALAFGQDGESRLIDALRETEYYIPELSVVALADTHLVGHIMLTRLPLRGDDGKMYETLALAPMSVTTVLQQMGIGGQMIRYAIEKPGNWVSIPSSYWGTRTITRASASFPRRNSTSARPTTYLMKLLWHWS